MWNSSDIELPPIATIPITIAWNSVLLAVYFPAIIFLYCFTEARKAHNFSEGGWTTLFVVRIAQALIGIIVPLAAAPNNNESQKSLESTLALPCSLLHDLGTFCIVLSLTRALFLSLDIWEHKALRRLWGCIMVLLPIPGYFLAGMMAYFRLDNDSRLQTYDSKVANGYNNAAYSVLRANTGALGGTMLVMAPCFVFVFVKRRPGTGLWSSSTATMTALIYLPTFILMLVALINNMFRFIPGHNPTTIQYFALSLASEIIVTPMWLFLAHRIGRCDKAHMAFQETIRVADSKYWSESIDQAFEKHTNGEKQALEKYSSTETSNTRQVKGVYDCIMYRLERLQRDYLADQEHASRNFDEEARWLIEDAKENARLVAACLVLPPCEACSLFSQRLGILHSCRGFSSREFATEKTTKLVLKAMMKDEAMKGLRGEELRWAVSDIVRIHLAK